MFRSLLPALTSLALLGLVGCSSEPATGTDAGGLADDAGSDAPAPMCTPHTPICIDSQIAELILFSTPADAGLITEEGTTAGEFLTHIDATAQPSGGITPTRSFVYARFTDTGLEQVVISDEDAFLDSSWDIAFRRYIIRLNSGVSGPGCVTGVRVPGDPTFDALTALPDPLALYDEAYYTESGGTCTIISDGSGLPGSVDSVLAGYWSYSATGCLSMNDFVYVIETGSGRHVKLTVVSYYSPANQDLCDSGGMPGSPSGSANFRVRWAFLD